MATYPDVHRALAPLSHASSQPITPAVAAAVAGDLNTWIYSAGGLCADATTRGAVLGLRDCCRTWGSVAGPAPADLYHWRNLTTTFLRRDLDVLGLDSFDFEQDSALLAKLEQELGRMAQAHRLPGPVAPAARRHSTAGPARPGRRRLPCRAPRPARTGGTNRCAPAGSQFTIAEFAH